MGIGQCAVDEWMYHDDGRARATGGRSGHVALIMATYWGSSMRANKRANKQPPVAGSDSVASG